MKIKILFLLASLVACLSLGFQHFTGAKAAFKSGLDEVAQEMEPELNFTAQLIPLWGSCDAIEQKKLRLMSDWEEIIVRVNLLQQATNSLLVATKKQQELKTSLLVSLEKTGNLLPIVLDLKEAWLTAQLEPEDFVYGSTTEDLRKQYMTQIDAVKKNIATFKSAIGAQGKHTAVELKAHIQAVQHGDLDSKIISELANKFCNQIKTEIILKIAATSTGYSETEAEELLDAVLKSRFSAEKLFNLNASDLAKNKSKK